MYKMTSTLTPFSVFLSGTNNLTQYFRNFRLIYVYIISLPSLTFVSSLKTVKVLIPIFCPSSWSFPLLLVSSVSFILRYRVLRTYINILVHFVENRRSQPKLSHFSNTRSKIPNYSPIYLHLRLSSLKKNLSKTDF